MITDIVHIDEKGIDFDSKELEKAASIIQSGGLVAFPTETVYGLGADAKNEEASAKIYAAKGRPSDNPLIVHIADISELEPLVTEIPESAKILMEKYRHRKSMEKSIRNRTSPHITNFSVGTPFASIV